MIERRPQHQVLVGPGTPIETNLAETIDISGHVRRIRTVKSLASPVGTFEIGCTFQVIPDGQVVSGAAPSSLSQLLVPDNVVTIRLGAGVDGSPLETVMVGYITGVQQHTTVNPDGQVVREIVISGQNAGKYLVNHEVPYFLLTARLLGESEVGLRRLEGLQLPAGSTIGEVLRTIFVQTFLRFVPRPRVVAQEVALLTHPSLEGDGASFGSFIGETSYWLKNGHWWNLFRDYADRPWNEVFGDTVPDVLSRFPTYNVVPADTAAGEPMRDASGAVRGTIGTEKGTPYFIVVRPQPFDREAWEALPTVVVPDAEIRMEQMRLAEDERRNLIMVKPQGQFSAALEGSADWLTWDTLQYDADSADRHGVRSMGDVRTLYSDLGGGAHQNRDVIEAATQGDGPLWETLKLRARKLWNWFSINHRLWKGVWVIAGNPRIRIGTRVQNEPAPGSGALPESEYTRRTYYVEQVIQDYVDGAHFLTHLGLTRGQALGAFVEAKEPDRLPVDAPKRPAVVARQVSAPITRPAALPEGAFGPSGASQVSGG